MTQRQRTMHVVMWLVLGPLALIGLILAVQWRPQEPVQSGGLPGVTDTTVQDVRDDRADGGGRP